MEFASRVRWIVIVAVFLIAIILIGWGLYSIARSLFNPLQQNGDSSQVESETISSVEQASTVRYIVDGPVVANKEHRSTEVTISRSVVSMKVYSQYGSKLVASKSYTNTDDAYEAFLAALEKLDVTDRVRGTDAEDDYNELGACAQGKRYILEIDTDIRRWSTSCRNVDGTAGFSMGAVRSLVEKQVPDFREILEEGDARL